MNKERRQKLKQVNVSQFFSHAANKIKLNNIIQITNECFPNKQGSPYFTNKKGYKVCKTLSKSVQGIVYIICSQENQKVGVLKRMPYDKLEGITMSDNKYIGNTQEVVKSPELGEILISGMTNILLEENIVPNFIYRTHVYFCKECDYYDTNKNFIKATPCLYILSEYVNGPIFYDYLKESKINYKELMNYIFQVLVSLLSLRYFGITHNDLHMANIMISNTFKEEKEEVSRKLSNKRYELDLNKKIKNKEVKLKKSVIKKTIGNISENIITLNTEIRDLEKQYLEILSNENKNISYTIKDKTYYVPADKLVKIIDFGLGSVPQKIQSIGLKTPIFSEPQNLADQRRFGMGLLDTLGFNNFIMLERSGKYKGYYKKKNVNLLQDTQTIVPVITKVPVPSNNVNQTLYVDEEQDLQEEKDADVEYKLQKMKQLTQESNDIYLKNNNEFNKHVSTNMNILINREKNNEVVDLLIVIKEMLIGTDLVDIIEDNFSYLQENNNKETYQDYSLNKRIEIVNTDFRNYVNLNNDFLKTEQEFDSDSDSDLYDNIKSSLNPVNSNKLNELRYNIMKNLK